MVIVKCLTGVRLVLIDLADVVEDCGDKPLVAQPSSDLHRLIIVIQRSGVVPIGLIDGPEIVEIARNIVLIPKSSCDLQRLFV